MLDQILPKLHKILAIVGHTPTDQYQRVHDFMMIVNTKFANELIQSLPENDRAALEKELLTADPRRVNSVTTELLTKHHDPKAVQATYDKLANELFNSYVQSVLPSCPLEKQAEIKKIAETLAR